MGALRPLSATCAQSSTIVHFCGPFGPLSKGNFRRKMTTIVGNRGQLWTSTLPFDTKSILTKNDSEINVHPKLRISNVIPRKSRSFPEILRGQNLSKIRPENYFCNDFVSEGEPQFAKPPFRLSQGLGGGGISHWAVRQDGGRAAVALEVQPAVAQAQAQAIPAALRPSLVDSTERKEAAKSTSSEKCKVLVFL